MTVSKETGALLDLKCYGNSDKPIMSVDLREIKINQGIPEDVFTMDISGYKEMPNYDFNMLILKRRKRKQAE